MTRTWLQRLFPMSRTARRAPAARLSPRLVVLEDRCTPAQFYVDPDFTGAAGTQVNFNSPGGPNEKIGATIGTDAFATIAAALAAANTSPGRDQIFLSIDTHAVNPDPVTGTGTLVVTDALDLIGSGKDKSIIQVTGDTLEQTGDDGAVFRTDGAPFNVSDLTLDGGGKSGGVLADSELVGSAFRFVGAVGSVTNVTIRDVIDDSNIVADPVNGVNFGFGVVAINKDATTRSNVTVTNSKFDNIGRVGISFFGYASGSVSGSEFIGRTAPTVRVQFGVEVVEGSSNIQITGNKFSGYVGNDPTFGSAAVQLLDNQSFDEDASGSKTDDPATAVIVGNSITGSKEGVIVGADETLDASDAFIRFNNISGNSFGVSTFTTKEVDALRNFWGDRSGPLAVNNQTAAGNNPGGTGNEVGSKVLYRQPGLNPNDGILIAAPPVAAVPVQGGTGLDAIGANVEAAYIAQTGFDLVSPQPTFAAVAGALPTPSKADKTTVLVRFGETVNGFDAGDLTVGGTAGGSVVSVTPTGTAGEFQVVLSATGEGTITLAIADAAAKTIEDVTGNRSLTAPATTVVVVDKTAPAVTIASADGKPFPVTFTDPLTVTFTFSEPVVGFDKTDITIGGTQQGGTVTEFTANATNTVFTAKIGGFTQKGDVTLAVDAGKATDPAGNPNTAAGPITITSPDVTPPTATIGIPGVQLPIQFNDPLSFTVTFSEPVNDFTAGDVQLGGTATGGTVEVGSASADRRTFTVTVRNFSAPGDVTVTIPAGKVTDDGGNQNLQAGPTLVATRDIVSPTVTIGAVTGTLPQPFTNPFSFTVTFSEPVTGFTTGDVQLGGTAAGGTVQSVTPDAQNKVFTVTVGGFTQQGTLEVTIPAGAANDAAGNGSKVAGPVLVATAPPDTTPPTVSITSPAGPLPRQFSTGPLTLTVTFSEVVSGFDKADVVIGGSATGGTVQSVTQVDDGKTYTVQLAGFVGRGSVTVTVPAGAAADAAGNKSLATSVLAAQFAAPFSRGFAAGGGAGIAQPFYPFDENLITGKSVFPFEASFTGGVRVATADVNGDGTLDIIVGPGPGRVNEVRVYDGLNPSKTFFTTNPFETSFTGGVFVHGADLNGDGKAEIIVSPDVTGGPRVRILDGAQATAGKVATVFDFFGIADANFRGGARVGSGDINADGTPDLFVAAGFGGGPRVAIFDGRQILQGKEARLAGDFFGYEQTLRNGVFVDGGDLDGDGFADVILGAGPGGGPRVRVLSGKALLTDNSQVEVANFFAGDEDDRGGVPVAGAELDGDGRIDLVAGTGERSGSVVRIYLSTQQDPINASPFGDFDNGVFVG